MHLKLMYLEMRKQNTSEHSPKSKEPNTTGQRSTWGKQQFSVVEGIFKLCIFGKYEWNTLMGQVDIFYTQL